MSGLEVGAAVFGIVVGAIEVVHKSVEIYGAVKDKSGIPRALRKVSDKLPSVEKILTGAHEQWQRGELNNIDKQTWISAKQEIQQCRDLCQELHDLLLSAYPEADSGKTGRLWKGTKTVLSGKGKSAEALLKEIWEYLELLSKEQIINNASLLEDIKSLVEELCPLGTNTIMNNTHGNNVGVIHGDNVGTINGDKVTGDKVQGNKDSHVHYHQGGSYTLSASTPNDTNRLHKEQEEIEWRSNLLNWLHFAAIEDRRAQVPKAHANTFRWMFTPNDHTTGFVTWVLYGEGIYWVRGKPACGKSTLLKYIDDEPQLEVLLDKWAGEKRLVKASYWFWAAGSSLQRSRLGLCRSLLHQILKSEKAACRIAFPDWKAEYSTTEPTFEMVKLAIERVLSARDQSTCFFFIIDGLDEYQTRMTDDKQSIEQGELADFMIAMARSKRVKLLLSSRPEPPFNSRFSEHHTLRLEHLTKNDIRAYVDARLKLKLPLHSSTQKPTPARFQHYNGLQLEHLDSEQVLRRAGTNIGEISLFELKPTKTHELLLHVRTQACDRRLLRNRKALEAADLKWYIHTRVRDKLYPREVPFDEEFEIKSNIGEHIIAHAEGVFLWVEIAVDIVCDGMEQRQTLRFIRGRLKKLPSELNALFAHILFERISKDTKLEAFKYLLMALEWHNSHDDVLVPTTALAVGQQVSDYNSACDHASLDRNSIEYLVDGIQEGLEIRCHGLLERNRAIRPSRTRNTVTFLHRTLLDFLRTDGPDGPRAKMEVAIGPHFNVHLAVMAGVTAHLEYAYCFAQSTDFPKSEIRSMFQEHALAEKSLDHPLTRLLLIMDNKIHSVHRRTIRYRKMNHWADLMFETGYQHGTSEGNADLLAYTIFTGAILHLQEEIENYGKALLARNRQPLLHYAVLPPNSKWDGINIPQLNREAAEKLLELGADPTCGNNYGSPWENTISYLVNLLQHGVSAEVRHLSVPSTLELLIQLAAHTRIKSRCSTLTARGYTATGAIQKLILESKDCCPRNTCIAECECAQAQAWKAPAVKVLDMIKSKTSPSDPVAPGSARGHGQNPDVNPDTSSTLAIPLQVASTSTQSKSGEMTWSSKMSRIFKARERPQTFRLIK